MSSRTARPPVPSLPPRPGSPRRRWRGGLRYQPLLPAWCGPQPVLGHLLEELLEARRESGFPTNSRGPDEDVNVYLAHLLAEHLAAPAPAGVLAGTDPLWQPPAGRGGAQPARGALLEHYRRNGDHRLLALGLYGRGDLLRRRGVPFGFRADEARARDLAAGRACYEMAAALRARLAGRAGRARGAGDGDGVALVLTKLARDFPGYVRVLEALARGRWGLGARLSLAALRELAPAPPPAASLDAFLDALSAWQRDPSADGAAAVADAARQAGVAWEPPR